jgi:hypothetical protein
MHVYTTRNAIQCQTPPGFNKNRRDAAKILLVGVSGCLFFGDHLWCTLLSAASILSLKEGTTSSAKNLKWMSLSVISFMASLIAFAMMQGHSILDEDTAYALKFELWFIATFIQVIWGAILGLFMIAAFTGMALPPSQSHQREATEEPRFNKNIRDLAKLLLCGVSCSLCLGFHRLCILLSAASILSLKEVIIFSLEDGTNSSFKNLNWMALSVISFMVSLVAFVMMQGHSILDEDEACALKFKLWFMTMFIQEVWGVILGLFMLSAFMSTALLPSSPHQRKATILRVNSSYRQPKPQY